MSWQILAMGAGAFGLRKQAEESPRRAAGPAQPAASDGVALGREAA